MHFTWEITFGQVVISVPITLLVFAVARIYGLLWTFRVEHELLMGDWAKRQTPAAELKDLPWRQKRWF
jgi:hypothetical protein